MKLGCRLLFDTPTEIVGLKQVPHSDIKVDRLSWDLVGLIGRHIVPGQPSDPFSCVVQTHDGRKDLPLVRRSSFPTVLGVL